MAKGFYTDGAEIVDRNEKMRKRVCFDEGVTNKLLEGFSFLPTYQLKAWKRTFFKIFVVVSVLEVTRREVEECDNMQVTMSTLS